MTLQASSLVTLSMRFIEHQGMVPKHLHGCYKRHGGLADLRHLKAQIWVTISKPTFVLGALTPILGLMK